MIPRWLRRDFEIERVLRAVVYAEQRSYYFEAVDHSTLSASARSLKGTKAMEVFMSERKREREL